MVHTVLGALLRVPLELHCGKSLLLAPEMGQPLIPEVTSRMNDWMEKRLTGG